MEIDIEAPKMSTSTLIPRPPRRRKHQACKECRQSKLRCDVPKNGMEPCSRCRDLGEPCEVDATYKRVNKKAKIDELSAQVQDLQAALKRNSFSHRPSEGSVDGVTIVSSQSYGTPITTTVFPNNNLPAIFDPIHRVSPGSQESGEKDGYMPNPIRPLVPSVGSPGMPNTFNSRKLDDVTLSSEQINKLFAEFFKHYHHLLSIVDPAKSPDQIFAISQLLFWTIIAVAARRFGEEPTLLASLAVSVKKLVWTEISNPPHSINTVKALLLLITWPLPTESEATDNTSVLIGVAMQAARKLGLHKPKDQQDFLRTKSRPTPEDLQETIKTWSVCNVLSQSYAASSGHQSLFAHDWTLDQACELGNELTLPDDIRHRLMVVRTGERLTCLLSGNRLDPGGIPFEQDRMQIFQQMESEMDDIYNGLFPKFSAINQCHYYAARLQLQSYYFFDLSDAGSRQVRLLKAYQTAVAYIQRVLDEDAATNILLYSPYELLRTFWLAMSVISDILRSSLVHQVNHEAGQRLFHAGIAGARRASVENNDMPGRLSVIMAQLWRKRNARLDLALEEPKLRIKSRLGASSVYNWLWHWRETFAGQADAYGGCHSSPDIGSGPNLFHGSLPEQINDLPICTTGDMPWVGDWGRGMPMLDSWEMPMETVF